MKAKIKLNPAVEWEGKEYSELDLSGLSSWNSMRYNSVAGRFRAAYPDAGSSGYESRTEFAWFIGNEATGLPVEFFQNLGQKYIRAMTLVILKNFIVTADELEEILEIED